jgi:hypothetical protein
MANIKEIIEKDYPFEKKKSVDQYKNDTRIRLRGVDSIEGIDKLNIFNELEEISIEDSMFEEFRLNIDRKIDSIYFYNVTMRKFSNEYQKDISNFDFGNCKVDTIDISNYNKDIHVSVDYGSEIGSINISDSDKMCELGCGNGKVEKVIFDNLGDIRINSGGWNSDNNINVIEYDINDIKGNVDISVENNSTRKINIRNVKGDVKINISGGSVDEIIIGDIGGGVDFVINDLNIGKIVVNGTVNFDNIEIINSNIGNLSELDFDVNGGVGNMNVTFDGGLEDFLNNCKCKKSLKSVNVNNIDSVEDLMFLNNYKNLKVLNIKGGDIEELVMDFEFDIEELTIVDTKLKKFDVGNQLNINKLVIQRSKLKKLDLTKLNKLDELVVTDGLLIDLNIDCYDTLRRIDVSYNRLDDLDLRDFKNIKYVDLSFNYFDKLMVDLTDVDLIHFGNNDFEELLFDGMNKMKMLIIDNNEKLKSVKILNSDSLSNVYIENDVNLSSIEIDNLPNLDTLTIDDAGISGEFVISGFDKLSKVVINNNSKLEIITLTMLPELNYVDLNNNKNLSIINVDNGNKIDVIKFSDTSVGEYDFKKHLNLDYVECQNSKLKKLDLSGFEGRVGELSCKNSQISEFIMGGDLSELEIVDIRYNKIEEFDYEIFRGLENFNMLFYEGNPLYNYLYSELYEFTEQEGIFRE